MINFEYTAKAKIKERNINWLEFPDQLYKILII